MSDPRIGIIGGSGLGLALTAAHAGAQTVEIETPFCKPSAPIVLSEIGGVPIAFLARHGVGHTIPPSAVPYRANIWALKSVGCKWILASGAVGLLNEGMAPRDLILADQFIDKTYRRVGTFFDEAGGGGGAGGVFGSGGVGIPGLVGGGGWGGGGPWGGGGGPGG